MSRLFRSMATMLLVCGIGSAAAADSIIVSYRLGGANTFNTSGFNSQVGATTSVGTSTFSGTATLTFNATASGAFATGPVQVATGILNVRATGTTTFVGGSVPFAGTIIFNLLSGQFGTLGPGGISSPILAATLGGFTPLGNPATGPGRIAATGPTAFAGGTPADFAFNFTGRPVLALGSGGTVIGTQTGTTTYTELSRTFVPMVTPIPEPSTAVLYALGLGVIGLRLRRR